MRAFNGRTGGDCKGFLHPDFARPSLLDSPASSEPTKPGSRGRKDVGLAMMLLQKWVSVIFISTTIAKSFGRFNRKI